MWADRPGGVDGAQAFRKADQPAIEALRGDTANAVDGVRGVDLTTAEVAASRARRTPGLLPALAGGI